MSFDELQFYLEGEPLPPRLSVPQLLAEVCSLPFEAAAQMAKVALETMANKGEAKACCSGFVDLHSWESIMPKFTQGEGRAVTIPSFP